MAQQKPVKKTTTKPKLGGEIGRPPFDKNSPVTYLPGRSAKNVPKSKNGKPIKKAFFGAIAPLAMKALPMLGGMLGGNGKKGGMGGVGGMLGGLLGGKNGKTIKKSRSGSSFGMLSVKAGVDNNPNPTAADRIVGAKKNAGKAKSGAALKKQAATAIAMKKAGKTPKAMMKMGGKIKKAQDGGQYLDAGELIPKAGPMRKTKIKERSSDGNYVTKTVTRTRKGATTKSSKTRRTLQGYLDGAPRVSELKNGGKMKSGGSMKKCRYGCK